MVYLVRAVRVTCTNGHIIYTQQTSKIDNVLALLIISAHADGGLLSLCRRMFNTVTWPPIDMSKEVLAPVTAKSPSNISPNPSEVICKVLKH